MKANLAAIKVERPSPHLAFAPAPLHVMAVEDNNDHFALLELQLAEERPKVRLTRATSFAEAARAAQPKQPDVVLLDLDLPDCSGLETLRRAALMFTDAPFLVLSSHNDTKLGLDAIQAGAADYVDKSVLCAGGLARRIAFARERFDAQHDMRRRSEWLHMLVAVLGHDLKTPPRQIGVLCGMIETALDTGARQAVSGHLDAVRSRCNHLKTLLDETMGYAVNAAKKPSKSEFSLMDLLDRVRADLDPDSRRRVHIAEDAMLFADPVLMFHVLRNLVENGLTYWRDTPSHVTVSASAGPQGTKVEISDTGMGIPAEMSKRVFEPITRGVDDNSFPGTGFGLTIVRLLVEAHGGLVSLESQPDAGTIVTLTLPANQLNSAQKALPEIQNGDPR